MGGMICKQPNGLYCRFSSVVDCPTDWNMTREDYINLCVERAKREAEDVLENHLRPFSEIEKRYQPNNMTRKEFKRFLQEVNHVDK